MHACDCTHDSKLATDRREELRVNCGTRGVPDTVAPFRAWRGSRDLVAQSPKFHASALALITRLHAKSLAHSTAEKMRSEFLRREISESLSINPEHRSPI